MLIVSGRLRPYRLPFKQPWRTHGGLIDTRSGWLLELTSDNGLQGYGDCAPLPMVDTEQPAAAKIWLEEHLPLLTNESPADMLARLPTTIDHPAARHALETALLDLLSQSEGQSLRHWLSASAPDEFEVNAAAGALDDNCVERIPPLLEQGFRVIKLKVGLASIQDELELLRRVSDRLPETVKLRLDANRAWSRSDAARFVAKLSDLPVESLEEPLLEPSIDTLRELQELTDTALALDESLTRFSPDELFETAPVRRLILKPCALGGLLPARELADRAAQAGLETLVTSTLESAVGIMAACQLAACLVEGKKPLAQGLATSGWFVRDIAEPPAIEAGCIRLSKAKGIGIRPYGDKQ